MGWWGAGCADARARSAAARSAVALSPGGGIGRRHAREVARLAPQHPRDRRELRPAPNCACPGWTATWRTGIGRTIAFRRQRARWKAGVGLECPPSGNPWFLNPPLSASNRSGRGGTSRVAEVRGDGRRAAAKCGRPCEGLGGASEDDPSLASLFLSTPCGSARSFWSGTPLEEIGCRPARLSRVGND